MPSSFVLSPLHQIEYAIPNLEDGVRFFKEVFGEHDVEQRFSAVLSNPALDIKHIGFGLTVQQLCKPLMEGLPHFDALQAFGPNVHNLCYLVDSIDAIAESCRAAGFEPLIEFPLTDIWNGVLPANNIQGNHQSTIFRTKGLFGFHLELAETPWITEPEPAIMLPAFGHQWEDQQLDASNRLRAVNIVVEDLGASLAALEAVFAKNLSVRVPAQTTVGSTLNYAVVELGLVRLVYWQAPNEGGEMDAFFQARGAAVHSLVSEVSSLESVRSALATLGVEYGNPDDYLLQSLAPTVVHNAVHIRSLGRVGVDFIVLQS